jgi:8-oxo-dGTP diphosphatase
LSIVIQLNSHPGPVLAVLAVLVRDGKVLLVQRGNQPDRGKWGFPGGKVELGETVTAAAVRELNEETGIDAAPGEVLTVLDFMDRDDSGAIRYHYAMVCVRLDWITGEGIAASDAMDVAWMTLAEIAGLGLNKSRDVEWLARLALGIPEKT